MADFYNRVAGNSVERLAALSDGVFAIAMTLLVLDLRTPVAAGIHSEAGLWQGLLSLAPQTAAYLLSFLTLGIFWNGQAAQLGHFRRSDRHLTWFHLAFLFPVSVLPFSTRLLAEFIDYRLSLLVYWCNILALGLVLLASWKYAERTQLIRPEAAAGVSQAIIRRIVQAQLLYAVGAALCLWNNWASIAFIVAVQLNYAIAPFFRTGSPEE